ncbi:hypothetical protein D3C76_1281220 [compost metagenome]
MPAPVLADTASRAHWGMASASANCRLPPVADFPAAFMARLVITASSLRVILASGRSVPSSKPSISPAFTAAPRTPAYQAPEATSVAPLTPEASA